MAIFGKSDNNVQGQPPVPDRPVVPAPSGGGPATPTTVIGAKVKFVGEISGDEDIVVQGRCEGNIRVNRKVTVAASGELQGDIHARWVVVGGRVHGQIQADERAELLASASVHGNVQAPKVIIAEGAQLQGNVAMSATAAPVSGPPVNPPPKKSEEI
ncbi:MAG: polymer-forming cytoskeletal protein [Acidobacteriota bacterium]